MRIFLDANILFSGAFKNGGIRRLLALACERGHRLVVDSFVVEEARRNLERKAPQLVAALDELLQTTEIRPQVNVELRVVPGKLDDKDIPVLLGALASASDVLLTGDVRHFGEFFGKELAGIMICSPLDLPEILNPD